MRQHLRWFSSTPALRRAVIGFAAFWWWATFMSMGVLLLGLEVMRLDALRVGSLITALALGWGSGSLVARRLAGPRGELALIPYGVVGMGLGTLLLAAVVPAYPWAMIVLLCIGGASGWLLVPLYTFLQRHHGLQESHSGAAARLMLCDTGIVMGVCVFWSGRVVLGLQTSLV